MYEFHRTFLVDSFIRSLPNIAVFNRFAIPCSPRHSFDNNGRISLCVVLFGGNPSTRPPDRRRCSDRSQQRLAPARGLEVVPRRLEKYLVCEESKCNCSCQMMMVMAVSTTITGRKSCGSREPVAILARRWKDRPWPQSSVWLC
jgi:hypothetical protein